MDAIDRAIVMRVQDGIPLVEDPFVAVARDLGIGVADLIGRIEKLEACGVIRRFGARVNNRRCGFVANAMIAWKVPEHRVDEIGSLFARNPVVTHCYERRTIPGRWEHNVFTMIHCRSMDEVEETVSRLSAESGIGDYLVLESGEEFKRTAAVRITNRDSPQDTISELS